MRIGGSVKPPRGHLDAMALPTHGAPLRHPCAGWPWPARAFVWLRALVAHALAASPPRAPR